MVFRGIEEIELIRIIVDSGSDLLPEVAREHNIQVLPLLANVNGIEYRDGIDLERDDFYALLEETGAFPKTSQVSPHTFAEAFKEARRHIPQSWRWHTLQSGSQRHKRPLPPP